MTERISFYIGICDDEEEWCTSITESCSRFMENKDADFVIYSYNKGEDLISDKDKEMDVLFLDVEMDSMDGLSVMKEVEKLSNIHNIVFVSSHSEAVWDSFGYKTKGFIRKPFSDEDIWNKLSEIYAKKTTDGVLKFSDFNGIVYYTKSEIVYLKADSNYVTIHTNDSEKVVTVILKECENMLGGLPFVRIHKSYIVNLDHVSNMSSSVINLKNGESLTIGRSYRDQVKNAYQDFLRRELHV